MENMTSRFGFGFTMVEPVTHPPGSFSSLLTGQVLKTFIGGAICGKVSFGFLIVY